MNKKEIKLALESRLEEKLQELRKQQEQAIEECSNLFVNEKVGFELTSFNLALRDLQESHAFREFMRTYWNLNSRAKLVDGLKQLNSCYKREFFTHCEQINDGTFEYDVFTSVNSYSGRPEERRIYDAWEQLITETKLEYEKLLAFLRASTAQKFIEQMEEIGFKIDIKKEIVLSDLPAPIFNINLLK